MLTQCCTQLYHTHDIKYDDVIVHDIIYDIHDIVYDVHQL